MHPVVLVATTRGYSDTAYATEHVHVGSIAVVDCPGRMLWLAVDPDYKTRRAPR
jgi:hypothetical protein